MSKRWIIKNVNPKLQVTLSDSLKVHPIIAQLLINREITSVNEAKNFLEADLSGLHDPFLFKNMDKVVERIRLAAQRKEKVLVFGDYDVDGVTSSVLMHDLLTGMGIEVINHIPHRVHDGYGLNHEIAEMAKSEGVRLLITVDCGISAKAEVETLNRLGIDVIVMDHHEPTEDTIPDAFAIINPKQKDCPYPFHELASVGLVAKLAQAIHGRVNPDMLDFVALGTIADVAPLCDENRIFVKAGLPRISRSKNLGLQALLEIAKITGKEITPYYVGFILGPRINATGRMDSAHKSLDLFLSQTKEVALDCARVLEKYNSDRQKMQKDTVNEALALVEIQADIEGHKVIVLGKEGWHKGVLGIVASKIAEKYYRPAIVISIEEGIGTASARSIEGFHLHDALVECAAMLENFGGHECAAGLTIKEENIDHFRTLINTIADKVLQPKKLVPTLYVDCDIPLSSATLSLAEIINAMEPFGEGNPTPVFCSRNVIVKSYPAVLGKDTLKFWVTDGQHTVSAVGFGMGKYAGTIKPGEKIDLAYELIIDDWNKAPTAQLKLKDIRLGQDLQSDIENILEERKVTL